MAATYIELSAKLFTEEHFRSNAQINTGGMIEIFRSCKYETKIERK